MTQMATRLNLVRVRRTVERRLLDTLLGVSAWVIERRLLAATHRPKREEPHGHVTMGT